MYQLMTVIAKATNGTTGGTAEGAGSDTGSNGAASSFWADYGTFIFIAVFAALFYFLLIRPGQKQRQAHQRLVSSVRKGDEVMTAGGIYGRVTKVGDDYVMLEIAHKTIIKTSKSSIARVESEETENEPEEDEEELEAAAEEAGEVEEGGQEK